MESTQPDTDTPNTPAPDTAPDPGPAPDTGNDEKGDGNDEE